MEKVPGVLPPVVLEGLVVGFLHTPVHADKVQEAILSAWRGHVGRQECVVHRSEPLLAVENDVDRIVCAHESIKRLACQSAEALGGSLPMQQAPDVVVKED